MDISWYGILAMLMSYIGLAWFLMFLCGEAALVTDLNFFYWLIVTASTVGYGDLSPQTPAGKLLVSIYIIPFGLSLFALTIGRMASFLSEHWKKGVKGLKKINLENHILVIGWNGPKTIHLLNLLLAEQAGQANKKPVALCTQEDIQNPMPGKIEYVKVKSYSDEQDMTRANVKHSSCIIIDTPDDDLTLTTSLFCHGQNEHAHIIAFFQDEKRSTLLKKHCPTVECTPSLVVEMLVKAAVDPGSSALHHDLLSIEEGQTQYSIQYPHNMPELIMSDLFLKFKECFSATIIGVSAHQNEAPNPNTVKLNPTLEHPIKPGTILYYIAIKRINQVDWSLFHV